MPFASNRRHKFWTADVRYLDAIDEHEIGGRSYVVTVLENHSRAILASAVTPTQDLSAFLSVLYRALERYGSPEALVTASGSIFLANQAKAVYGAAGIAKDERYIETTFNIQRRMADWHFARASDWPELAALHDRLVEDYNSQAHWAHRWREDGRLSPAEVLGWVTGLRYRPEDLERAFFASRFSRILDALGYATTFRRWRLYGEEGLAGRETALWLHAGSFTLEHGGRALSRYDVERTVGTDRLASVARPRLFQTPYALAQTRLFGLDEAGWLKTLRLREYADRKPRRPAFLQQALLAYLDAL